jgi:hypothetical protein
MILLARFVLLLAMALPFVTWSLDRFVLRRKVDWPLFSLLTWIGCFVIAWVAAFILEIGIESEMNSHDLDGDGSITGSELTPDAKEAMERWSSDTGRNFGIFLAIPFFAIWTATVYIALSAASLIARSRQKPDRG